MISPKNEENKCDNNKINSIHLMEKIKTTKNKNDEFEQLVKMIIQRFIRGFCSGVAIRVGYVFIKALLKKSLKNGFYKAWAAIRTKSTLQIAAFLGLFPSLYRASLHYIKKARNIEDGWNYLLSGAIAGLSILSLDKSNRETITFLSLTRAIGAGLPALVEKGHLPNVRHIDFLVYSIGCGIILFSALLRPDYLSPGYYQTIVKWSRNFTEEIANNHFRNPGPRFVTCQEAGLHKESCIKFNILDIKRGIPTMSRIFFPVHVLPILLYKRKAFMTSPLPVIKAFIKNMAASTLFFVTSSAITKSGLCLFRNALHKPPPLPAFVPLVVGTTTGIGLLWERKSRRKELALFTAFQMLGIFYTAFKKSQTASKLNIGVPQGFVILFSLASMIIMHVHETQPGYLNSITKAGLTFLVGDKDIYSKWTESNTRAK